MSTYYTQWLVGVLREANKELEAKSLEQSAKIAERVEKFRQETSLQSAYELLQLLCPEHYPTQTQN